jgi:two-component system sensor histidine kinase BarA
MTTTLKQQVLVIDDSAVNRMIIQKHLEAKGFDVIQAESGEQAIELIHDHQFVLVFTDIEMPGINGRETSKALRKAGCRAPIIAVSAHAPESMDESRKAGMNGFITKPVRKPDIEKMLRRHLS